MGLFSKPPVKFNNQDKVDRAAAVKALLQHPLVCEFFERAEFRLFENFKSPNLTDDQVIELHRQQQALDAFRMFFQQVLTDGKIAEKEIAAEK